MTTTNYFLVLILTVVLYTSTYQVLANVDCITTTSAKSTNNDDARTSAECPSSHSTLVSCGGKTHDPLGAVFDGTHIDPSIVPTRCYSNNAKDGLGVYAYARCCNFIPSDITCQYLSSSSYSSSADDAYITTSCGTTHNILLGCTVHTPWAKLDGAFAGSRSVSPDSISHFDTYNYPSYNQCTAQNGQSGRGVKANLACCRSPTYSLTCITRYGSPTHPLSTVSCPSGYFMSGCSAFGYHLPNGWWINNDRCYARSSNTNNVYSIATCCKLQTDSPTTDPTPTPTPSPTPIPSSSPTEIPSSSPTKLPTLSPSDMPTTIPTVSPTNNPSLSPSDDPTESPTSNPSQTQNPTISPTEMDYIYIPLAKPDDTVNTSLIAGLIGALVFLFLCFCGSGFFFAWYCWKKKKILDDAVNEAKNDGKSQDIISSISPYPLEGADGGTMLTAARMTSNAASISNVAYDSWEQKDNIAPKSILPILPSSLSKHKNENVNLLAHNGDTSEDEHLFDIMDGGNENDTHLLQLDEAEDVLPAEDEDEDHDIFAIN